MTVQTKDATLLMLLLCQIAWVSCFQSLQNTLLHTSTAGRSQRWQNVATGRTTYYLPTYLQSSEDSSADDDGDGDDDSGTISQVDPPVAASVNDLEKTWRYVKKPLLSIGAKGATASHGNSLKELLESHTAVKVKVNTKSFGTLEKAFTDMRDLAVEAGAPEGIEMLQTRDKDKVILFALPGTLEKILTGDYPPPPPPPRPPREEEE